MDKAALVTGGSSGIGFAIASMLQENGFALTLAARTATKVEAAAEQLGAHAVTADVGIAGPIDELETKHIDLQLNVNLRGTILVTAAALPLLRESHGLIVNLASIAGTSPSPQLPVYGASKAAVIQFTNSLNRCEEEHGIRATA